MHRLRLSSRWRRLPAASTARSSWSPSTRSSPLAVDHLNVQATIGASTRSFVVPLANKTIPPSHSFGVQVADSFAGTFTVHLDAIDPDGNVVGQLDGSVSLGGGGKISLPLTFGARRRRHGQRRPRRRRPRRRRRPGDARAPSSAPRARGNTLVTTCSDGTSMSAGCALGCSSNGHARTASSSTRRAGGAVRRLRQRSLVDADDVPAGRHRHPRRRGGRHHRSPAARRRCALPTSARLVTPRCSTASPSRWSR